MRVLNWLWVGCFFTASFDILLLVNIGGSIRISQILHWVCSATLLPLVRVIQDVASSGRGAARRSSFGCYRSFFSCL